MRAFGAVQGLPYISPQIAIVQQIVRNFRSHLAADFAAGPGDGWPAVKECVGRWGSRL